MASLDSCFRPTFLLVGPEMLSQHRVFFPECFFALDLILDHSEVKVFPVFLIVLFVFPCPPFLGISPSKGYPEAFLPRVFFPPACPGCLPALSPGHRGYFHNFPKMISSNAIISSSHQSIWLGDRQYPFSPLDLAQSIADVLWSGILSTFVLLIHRLVFNLELVMSSSLPA